MKTCSDYIAENLETVFMYSAHSSFQYGQYYDCI
jgi:hypothetical protein